MNFGLELHEHGHGGQCRKLDADCNIVVLLGEGVDGTGSDFVVMPYLTNLQHNVLGFHCVSYCFGFNSLENILSWELLLEWFCGAVWLNGIKLEVG
jgi:hypothetical protein